MAAGAGDVDVAGARAMEHGGDAGEAVGLNAGDAGAVRAHARHAADVAERDGHVAGGTARLGEDAAIGVGTAGLVDDRAAADVHGDVAGSAGRELVDDERADRAVGAGRDVAVDGGQQIAGAGRSLGKHDAARHRAADGAVARIGHIAAAADQRHRVGAGRIAGQQGLRDGRANTMREAERIAALGFEFQAESGNRRGAHGGGADAVVVAPCARVGRDRNGGIVGAGVGGGGGADRDDDRIVACCGNRHLPLLRYATSVFLPLYERPTTKFIHGNVAKPSRLRDITGARSNSQRCRPKHQPSSPPMAGSENWCAKPARIRPSPSPQGFDRWPPGKPYRVGQPPARFR